MRVEDLPKNGQWRGNICFNFLGAVLDNVCNVMILCFNHTSRSGEYASFQQHGERTVSDDYFSARQGSGRIRRGTSCIYVSALLTKIFSRMRIFSPSRSAVTTIWKDWINSQISDIVPTTHMTCTLEVKLIVKCF